MEFKYLKLLKKYHDFPTKMLSNETVLRWAVQDIEALKFVTSWFQGLVTLSPFHLKSYSDNFIDQIILDDKGNNQSTQEKIRVSIKMF